MTRCQAWVTFHSVEAATLAFTARNKQYIGERYIKLFIQ